MVVVWLSFYCTAILLPIVWGDGNDHIHIKLHLPELRKKHTHVKTVYKHHFHPKKITPAFGNKIELDGSYSMLNPMYSFPKASPYNQLEFPSSSWLPEKFDVNPALKSQFKPLSLNNNWPKINSSLKHLHPQNQLQPQIQAELDQDYNSNGKFSEDAKSYDDDEDEEYTMTEDSINEQPLALQMHLGNPAHYKSAPQIYSGTRWSGPTRLPSSPERNFHWPQHLSNGNYFTKSEVEDMQRYQNYRNMQQLQVNPDFETEDGLTTMKSTKQAHKRRSKKRKRLNGNKKINNNFFYATY